MSPEELSLHKAEINDAKAARVAAKMSPMPAVICISLTAMVAGALSFMLVHPVPDSNRELIYYMLGQITGLWAGSVAYWVGTTRSSAEKTRLIK